MNKLPLNFPTQLIAELGNAKYQSVFELAEEIISKRPKDREKYIKGSKFKKGLENLNNQQLMFLSYCLIYDEQVVEMVKSWSKAVDNTVQILAMKDELLKRGMIVNHDRVGVTT